MVVKEYKRKGYAPDLVESDNISAVINILSETVKAGRPAAFEDSEEGLEEFKKCTLDYLQYVQQINNSDIDKKIMIDIESWACFLGITRSTILNYEKCRSEDWKQFIEVIKNGICAAKKEAAFHGQLQPMIAVFDLANNHSYKNTSEFKLEVEAKKETTQALTPDEIAEKYSIEYNPDEIIELPQVPD